MHDQNAFITLTYDNEHLPGDLSLQKDHFQKFMKRLRKHLAPLRVRYYQCGEYGGENQRPHYHACIFGYDFPDKTLWKEINGQKLYISDTLTKIWGKGYTTIGDVTFESAAYVARYIMKKVTGKNQKMINDQGLKAYELLDSTTGEIIPRIPEYTSMSLKPGIGATWYETYHRDLYPSDTLVLNGTRMRPPKYYDTLLEKSSLYGAQLLHALKNERSLKAAQHSANNTPERLSVRERLTETKLDKLIRNL